MLIVIAVVLALGVFNLLTLGVWGFALSMSDINAAQVDTTVETSILNTIVNIVPANFIETFLKSDN